ncbi:MAG TPA: aldolase [Rhabdaerophilum sp.]|nr:aldolase [Rhabdaerophilum sp.]
MMRDEARLREALVEAGRHFHARGLAIGTAGNLSIRLDDGYLVTPTNASLGRLDAARLARLDADFQHLSGDSPTKEVSMHRAFYETRPRTEAVVHLHSTHAAALSFCRDLPSLDPIPVFSPYYLMRVGHLPVLPYFRPGSEAIGTAIRALQGRYRAVLLANHGPVNTGASLQEAITSAEELEETARIFLMLGKERLRLLDNDEIADLVAAFHLDW